jgi:translocation and assembly module TamB
MRKFLKYSFRSFLGLILVIAIGLYILLYTQVGANWIVSSLVNNDSIQIKQVEGSVATKLKLNDITYKDPQLVVHANQLSYVIKNIHWFSKGIVFEKIDIKEVTINLLDSPQPQQNSTAFEGFNLPISVRIDSLYSNHIALTSSQTSHDFKNFQAKIEAQDQQIQLTNLNLEHQNFNLQGLAGIELSALLPFQISPVWQLFYEDYKVNGEGTIHGTVNKIELDQHINSEAGIAIGKASIISSIDLSQSPPQIEAFIKSDLFSLNVPEVPQLKLQSLSLNLFGQLDSYSLKSDFILESQQLEKTSFNLIGDGNLDSVNFKQLNLSNSSAQISIPTQISWQQNISTSSHVNLTQFNPAIYFKEWQGLIDGSASLKTKLFKDGRYEIDIHQAWFDGTLKQQAFSLKTDIEVTPETIKMAPSTLLFGNNKVDINATIKQQNIDAKIVVNLLDLSVLDKQLKGEINSNFSLLGDIKNPEIDGLATINNIKYNSFSIDTLKTKVKGNWLENLSLSSNATQININKNSIESMQIDLNGNTQSHQLSATIEDASMISSFEASGAWNELESSWKGIMNKQDILIKAIDSNWSKWSLVEPVRIEYQNDLSLHKSCWHNLQTNGDFCLNFDINSSINEYLIKMDLNKLEAQALKPFLPNELDFNGQLQGKADLRIADNEVQISSKIQLLNGQFNYGQGTLKAYKAKFNKAELVANYDNTNSNVTAFVDLNDGTHLELNLNVFKNTDQQLAIKGIANGYFANTAYLASLSDEIDEMNGDFKIEADIEGVLTSPVIHLIANQENGALILSQTKSKIENISIQLNKLTNQPYQIQLFGDSGKGSIQINGKIETDESNSWQFNATAIGENFELLRLPEVELDISPNFNIQANPNGINLTGKFKVPYAKVFIEQLPDSAISSSSDVVIHQSAEKVAQNENYAIDFDVHAEIENPIKISAVGLNTDLTGSLRINNIENTEINGYGTLILNNGKYSIYGQTLDISRGELIFNGPIDNPNLDIIASRKSLNGEVIAGVELGGTINQLESSLYSTPSLSDLEILSYIMTGKSLNQESNMSTSQLAQAAILLGLQKSSPIFSEIQTKLGIDVLTIKEGATAKDSLVEAGKNFNDKLYVGYNQGLFNRVGFWILKYKINQALRLESTQGENQSVDLIYLRKKK